jgi:hypothetical protein
VDDDLSAVVDDGEPVVALEYAATLRSVHGNTSPARIANAQPGSRNGGALVLAPSDIHRRGLRRARRRCRPVAWVTDRQPR